MKKLIPLLCALALLLCGCGRAQAPTTLTLSPRAIPESGKQAVKYFRQDLDYAIKEDNYVALVCASNMYDPLVQYQNCEFTLKDIAFIRSLLTTLKEAEFSSVEWFDSSLSGCGGYISFYLEYENGLFPLCSVRVEEVALGISYSESSAYECTLRDPELAEDIQRMIEQQCVNEGFELVPILSETEGAQ